MKSTLLVMVTTILLLVSCSKDDKLISEKELIAGYWKATRNLDINDKNEIIHRSEDFTGCGAETAFEFKQDGTCNYIGYCNSKKVKSGSYTYNESTKELVLNYNNGSSETFTVHSVTAAELWFNFGKINTGENIYNILVLTKS